MSSFVSVFFELRELMFSMLNSCLGSLISPQIELVADVILWFTWLWIFYHVLFKPFITVFSFLAQLYKNKFFKELEKDE